MGYQTPPRLVDREIWLPFLDSFRTLCLAPPPEIKRVFEELEQLPRSLWGEAGPTSRGGHR